MSERSPARRGQTGALVFLLVLLSSWAVRPLAVWAEAETFYIETTGHYISNEYGFLNYWRSPLGERMLGAPVTELLIENDIVVQYYERGRLESHVGVDDAPVMLGHVGAEYASALWKSFAPAPLQPPSEEGYYVFRETEHTLREPLLSFWREHEGLQTLGYPISELQWEYVGNTLIEVQYFERGRLEYRPLASDPANVVQLSSLGRDLALLRGYDTSPIGPAALQAAVETPADTTTEEALESPQAASEEARSAAAPAVPQGATPPQQTFFRSSPSAEEADWEVAYEEIENSSKHIVVSLGKQWLYAYENNVLLFETPVTTGMDGFETPEGHFFIYARNPLQTMSGNLGGEYSVPNVPNSMYLKDDVAMHGTYWHNEFGNGNRRSHGCVNLPLDAAAWLYNWAPVGTPVDVVGE